MRSGWISIVSRLFHYRLDIGNSQPHLYSHRLDEAGCVFYCFQNHVLDRAVIDESAISVVCSQHRRQFLPAISCHILMKDIRFFDHLVSIIDMKLLMGWLSCGLYLYWKNWCVKYTTPQPPHSFSFILQSTHFSTVAPDMQQVQKQAGSTGHHFLIIRFRT